MVNTFGNALPNANQLYMAALMTAPMLLLEPLLMRPMYPDKRLNTAVWVTGGVLLIGSFFLIREQAAI
ncbi:DUF305 domain-containing protein, partial [Salmonella enterica subsp. enterica serovar Minnesota]|uniref:hypothetical protein n=1 Tax=Salmonella enterica TaxID=28901 RepID=UPI003D268F15